MTEFWADQIAWHLPPFRPEPADPDPFVSALIERVSYRALSCAALEALYDAQRQHDRLRERYERR